MSKISEKLDIINNSKNDIKTAIENKGVVVGNVGIQDYAKKIDAMEVKTPVEKGLVINKIDADGFVTDASIVGMTAIPDYYLYYAILRSGSNENKRTWLSKIGENLHLPNDLTSIGSDAFYGCNQLLGLILPDTLIFIGEGAFQSCSRFTLKSLPSGIENIGENCFRACSELDIKILPSGITLIPNSCFYACSKLIELTCEGDIKSINGNAFYNSKLEKLVLPNVTSVPTLANISAFTNTPIRNGSGYVYFPDSLVEEAKEKTNWSTIASQIKGVSEL